MDDVTVTHAFKYAIRSERLTIHRARDSQHPEKEAHTHEIKKKKDRLRPKRAHLAALAAYEKKKGGIALNLFAPHV